MVIVAIGINHRTAPVEIRERVTLLEDGLTAAAAQLGSHVAEGAVLSTCNRTEIYATVGDAASGLSALKRFLSSYSGLPIHELEPYLYTHTQNEAVRHLFAVASGIDSQILGETEILGQVRDALVLSSAAGVVGVPISRLFHAALRTGRMAREQTAISRQAVSVSSAGVHMARQVFGGLDRCKVLVISAGEAGALTARCLKDAGASGIAVANRTRAKAVELALELGGHTIDFEDVPRALVDFDVVISATASSRYVLSGDAVAKAMERRDNRALCLIDIAVPRDIDPDSRKVKNVYLYDIDDLEAASLSGLKERQKSVAQVERIVGAETDKFMQWLGSLEVVPVVRALHEKAERIRQRELKKSLARLDHLLPDDQARVEALTIALTNKLLHDPITSLKGEGSRAGNIDAARKLFRLPVEGEPPPIPQP